MASHLRTTGCHKISCHTVLLAARHKLAQPALTAASKAGTRFTYLKGMEGLVDLGALITPRPGIERDRLIGSPTPNRCATSYQHDTFSSTPRH